jgi:hypothetical protein
LAGEAFDVVAGDVEQKDTFRRYTILIGDDIGTLR